MGKKDGKKQTISVKDLRGGKVKADEATRVKGGASDPTTGVVYASASDPSTGTTYGRRR